MRNYVLVDRTIIQAPDRCPVTFRRPFGDCRGGACEFGWRPSLEWTLFVD
jgi:hypothetical protein